MYKTSRSQRNFWNSTRREIQNKNRAKNINQIKKQDSLVKNRGYLKIEKLNKRFRAIVIQRAKKLGHI